MTQRRSFARRESRELGPKWLRSTVFPLFLLCVCPPFVFLLWFAHVQLDGSMLKLTRVLWNEGLVHTLSMIWLPRIAGSVIAWKILGVYVSVELLLLRFLPGKLVMGPCTAQGHTPKYVDNGVASFAITIGLYLTCSYVLHWFPASILYDQLGDLLGALNLSALLLCVLLYLKGRYAPSTPDHGLSGNPIFDYYWGTELYPSILGWDVKRMTNCRIAMMGWPLLLLSFAAKQQALYGLSDSMICAVGLQLLYVAKFFHWETGYLRSLDMMHDRAGFYLCWGCLVWLPCVYTSPTLYLVNHPITLGAPLSVAICLLGALSIAVNYLADVQRQRVRATQGKTRVWGKPPKLIVGHYTTEQGERKESLLLASGYWGLARHFHYLPELTAAFFWTVPALFDSALPYFYVVFLAILLIDRSFRDDARCAKKYGSDWDAYRKLVPSRIIPGIF